MVFWIAFAVVAVLRLLAAGLAPIAGDEAYYWLWAQHPAWGYYDHPPMVAWLIAASTAVLGRSAFAIRLPFVLLGLGVPLLGRRLAYEMSGSRGTGDLAAGLLMVVPYFGVEGATATPDAPLLFFWTLALGLSWRAIQRDRWGDWLWAGAAFGLALLSKLMALLLLPGIGLWMLLARRWSPRTGWFLLAAAATCSGFVAWNLQHHFEPVMFQLWQRHGQSAPPTGLLPYLGLQAAALSPFLLAGCIMALFASFRSRDEGLRFLACCGAVPILTIGIFSLRESVEIFWPLEGYLSLLVALAWMLQQVEWPWSRKAAAVALMALPGCVVTLLIYGGAMWPAEWLTLTQMHARPGFTGNDVTELHAFEPLAEDLRTMPGFVLTEHYGLSSALWYYSGRPTVTLPLSLLGREFQRWQDPPSLAGQDATFIDRSPLDRRDDVRALLQASFASVEVLPPRRYERFGHLARVFYLARCRGFKGRFVIGE